MSTLTGLTFPELGRWLREMQKACALTGQAALAAVDVVLWSWTQAASHAGAGDSVPLGAPEPDDAAQDAAYALWMVGEDIGRLGETVARLRGSMDVPGSTAPWEAESLRRRADALGHLAGPEARATAAEDIAKAKAEAAELADLLDVTVHRQALRFSLERQIVNAGSVQGIVGAVDRSLAELEARGQATDADRQIAREAKTRAAKYRSDKRLAEAEVVAAGGAVGKAERMRAEAAVLLRQDMARAGIAS